MIECPKCHSPLEKEFINGPDFVPCPNCHQAIKGVIFPAFFQKSAPAPVAESLVISDEANCFYHQDKKAIIPCSSCGRFLCALCDIEFDGQHLCSSCLQAGASKKKIRNLDKEAVCYDKIAFSVAFFPIFTVVFTLFTAPIAVYLCIRYWNRTSVTGSKVRMVIALIMALLEIFFWYLVFSGAFNHHHRHPHGY